VAAVAAAAAAAAQAPTTYSTQFHGPAAGVALGGFGRMRDTHVHHIGRDQMTAGEGSVFMNTFPQSPQGRREEDVPGPATMFAASVLAQIARRSANAMQSDFGGPRAAGEAAAEAVNRATTTRPPQPALTKLERDAAETARREEYNRTANLKNKTGRVIVDVMLDSIKRQGINADLELAALLQSMADNMPNSTANGSAKDNLFELQLYLFKQTEQYKHYFCDKVGREYIGDGSLSPTTLNSWIDRTLKAKLNEQNDRTLAEETRGAATGMGGLYDPLPLSYDLEDFCLQDLDVGFNGQVPSLNALRGGSCSGMYSMYTQPGEEEEEEEEEDEEEWGGGLNATVLIRKDRKINIL